MPSKCSRRKRGISPVISNLILLTAVIGAGLFLWWFAISRAGIASEVYADEIGEGIEKLEERFVIEHIEIDKSDGSPYDVVIYVYNYGKIDVKIVTIYVENTRLTVPFVDVGINQFVPIPIPSVLEVPEFLQVESERGNVVIGYP